MASAKPSGAVALPPVDLDVVESWRHVLNGVNQIQRTTHTPEQIAQCISTLLTRERVPHKAMVGFIDGRNETRTSISAWIEFPNGSKLPLKMPEDIERMSEQGLVDHLKKNGYRIKTLDAKPLAEIDFRAISGMPITVFRCFGAFYDESTILHTAVPKSNVREFSQHLHAKRVKA